MRLWKFKGEHLLTFKRRTWFAWRPVMTWVGELVWLEKVDYMWNGSSYDPGYIYAREGQPLPTSDK